MQRYLEGIARILSVSLTYLYCMFNWALPSLLNINIQHNLGENSKISQNILIRLYFLTGLSLISQRWQEFMKSREKKLIWWNITRKMEVNHWTFLRIIGIWRNIWRSSFQPALASLQPFQLEIQIQLRIFKQKKMIFYSMIVWLMDWTLCLKLTMMYAIQFFLK